MWGSGGELGIRRDGSHARFLVAPAANLHEKPSLKPARSVCLSSPPMMGCARLAPSAPGFRRYELCAERVRKMCDDFVLQVEQVGQGLVKTFRPQMLAALGIEELDIDAHPGARAAMAISSNPLRSTMESRQTDAVSGRVKTPAIPVA